MVFILHFSLSEPWSMPIKLHSSISRRWTARIPFGSSSCRDRPCPVPAVYVNPTSRLLKARDLLISDRSIAFQLWCTSWRRKWPPPSRISITSSALYSKAEIRSSSSSSSSSSGSRRSLTCSGLCILMSASTIMPPRVCLLMCLPHQAPIQC